MKQVRARRVGRSAKPAMVAAVAMAATAWPNPAGGGYSTVGGWCCAVPVGSGLAG